MHKKSVNVLQNIPYFDFYSGFVMVSRTSYPGYDIRRAILMAMVECSRIEKETKNEAHCVVRPNGAFRYHDPNITIGADSISISAVNLGKKETILLKPSDFPFKKIKFTAPRVRAYLNSHAVEFLGATSEHSWEINHGFIKVDSRIWANSVYINGKNAELLDFNNDDASFSFERSTRWKIKENGGLSFLHGINLNNENERFDFPVLTII
uniref:FHA domain-containing protein n=1 Tax=Rhizobium phage IG49 TaxID=3129228 RepID=A0AAU8HYR8_9CAUD